MKNKTYLPQASIAMGTALVMISNPAMARSVMPLGKAVGAVLGSTSATKKVIEGKNVFVLAGPDHKAKKVAVIADAKWEGKCDHRWVIGVDPSTNKITDIEVTDLSCPHADPMNDPSFLDQFKGKGPADVKGQKMLTGITTVVKATGSCNLTNEEVVKAITLVQKHHAEL